MEPQQYKPKQSVIKLATITSLILHLVLLGFIFGRFESRQRLHELQEKNLEIDFIDTLTTEPVPLPKEQKNQVNMNNQKLKQQIVDQPAQKINQEIPDNTRFLSRHNQVVKKQTRAIRHGIFRNAGQWQNFQPQNQFLKHQYYVC